MIIELLTCCRSGIGQCTHGRGGAESVLTLSPTVIGVVLHRLGANLTRRKGKYTSASPRCTCLPSRQICIGVALGDPPQTPLQCWLVGRTSTPPWCTCLPTRQHCTEVALGGPALTPLKATESKSKFNEAQPSWTWTRLRWTWLRCTCPPPSATSVQCWREGRQVHRGAAEVYLSSVRVNIAEESVMDHRVQLQCKVYEEGGKYTEAQPRCTCPSYESTLHTSRWSPCPVTDGLDVSTLTFLLLQKGENWLSRVTFWTNLEYKCYEGLRIYNSAQGCLVVHWRSWAFQCSGCPVSTVHLLFKNFFRHHVVPLLSMHARCLRLQRVVRGGFCYTLNDQLLLILQFICWKWTWLRWKRTSFCRKRTSIRRKWTSHRWKRTSLRRKRTSLFSFLKSIFDGWSPFSTAIYKWTWLFQSIVFLTDFTRRKCTKFYISIRV